MVEIIRVNDILAQMQNLSDPKYRGYQLPEPLKEALRKFGEWSDAQLLHEQNALTPTAPLYHYTGRKSLKGILEHQHLWCFSHAEQDDVEEFDYSLNIARRELKRVATRGPSHRHIRCRRRRAR